MIAGTAKRLSPADCLRKAKECRPLAAGRTMSVRERIMLMHIADTWERISKTAKGEALAR